MKKDLKKALKNSLELDLFHNEIEQMESKKEDTKTQKSFNEHLKNFKKDLAKKGKETRSIRINLLTTPTQKAKLQKLSHARNESINTILFNALELYLELEENKKLINKIEKFENE